MMFSHTHPRTGSLFYVHKSITIHVHLTRFSLYFPGAAGALSTLRTPPTLRPIQSSISDLVPALCSYFIVMPFLVMPCIHCGSWVKYPIWQRNESSMGDRYCVCHTCNQFLQLHRLYCVKQRLNSSFHCRHLDLQLRHHLESIYTILASEQTTSQLQPCTHHVPATTLYDRPPAYISRR